MEIKGIQFGTLSSEQIKKLSVVEITAHDVYDKGVPKYSGLSDLRLGTIDRQFKCSTCKNNAMGCSGHFGHINLECKIYHICFVKYTTKVLQSICLKCSRLKGKFSKRLNGNKQFKKVFEVAKSKQQCEHCEEFQAKVTSDKTDIFVEDENGKNTLSASKCFELFSKIPEEDLVMMGFNKNFKPTNFIIDCILVPPPHVRPSISMDASLKSQDDLTHKLSEIVKTNNLLKKQLENQSDSISIKGLQDLIQYHVTTYIDNGIPGISQATQRTGRPIKAICQRLKSKEGRIRGNLMGKRVNFSARTVITAEPNIDLDELGVPFILAKTLTYPEKVTKYNLKKIQEYVDNGYDPAFGNTGAKLVHQGGVQKDIRFVKNIKLQIGDTVERHLKDGDYVVFNRQPSLHKMSMMGHKIRVMPYSTFRMNVCATTPYNADYDGDEMNIHVPQSEITKSEVINLMCVQNNIVSPQSNKPVIGIIQDTLLGCHKITKDNVFITKSDMCSILMKLRFHQIMPEPAIRKPKILYTGKQVISLLFPENFNYSRKVGDNTVTILSGKLISGVLCKKTLGTSEGGIIHMLWLKYGAQKAKEFISNIQYVINYWLNSEGFSIGAMDIFIDNNTNDNVREVIYNAKSKVKQIIEVSLKNKHIDNVSFENKINQTLNNAMSQAGLIVQKNIPVFNNINTSVTGGSKGSMFNIAQIMGCVGQQNVSGKRLDFGYIDRVMSHFERNDKGPEAKGFVEHSYKTGLDPHEFFYHAMGGREGIIDTAVKTSETGYIQRRLVKAMEDIKVHHDKSVRNAIGDIVQFCYGDDGLDSTYLIKENIIKDISLYSWDNVTKDEMNMIRQSFDYISSLDSLRTPLIITDICNDIKTKHKYAYNTLDSKTVFEKVKGVCQNISIKQNNIFCTKHIVSCIYLQFCTKFLCNKYLTLDDIDYYCEILHKRYTSAIVQHGEMIGIVAAQSLGEPVTQLTLNTFHAAGISAKNVTLGVPRFKELINVTKSMKSPSMKIAVMNSHFENSNELDKHASSIEKLTLDMIISNSCIVDNQNTTSEYLSIPDIYTDLDFYQYNIRYNMNKRIFSTKRLSLLDITVKIMKEYKSLHCIASDEFSDELYIDVYVYNDNELSLDSIKLLSSQLKTQIINGFSSVSKVYTDSNKNILETDGTDLQTILNLEWCDPNNTFCNDVLEVRDILGIEAARELLLREIKQVLEFDGTYINERHFQILVDVMTYKGGIMAITRHGINRSDNGPLMKCSFEETVDVLTESAVFGDFDGIKGVTESITVGKLANMGTGTFDIKYNLNDVILDSDSEEEEFFVEAEKFACDTIKSDDEYIESFYDDISEELVESYF